MDRATPKQYLRLQERGDHTQYTLINQWRDRLGDLIIDYPAQAANSDGYKLFANINN